MFSWLIKRRGRLYPVATNEVAETSFRGDFRNWELGVQIVSVLNHEVAHYTDMFLLFVSFVLPLAPIANYRIKELLIKIIDIFQD